MINVFTYGSLMYPPIWKRVVLGDYEHSDGYVSGYRRLRILSKVYPALIRGDQRVQGVIWFQVSTADVDRLDRFEGAYYRRSKCFTKLIDGSTVRCQVYLWNQCYQDLLLNLEWDPSAFEKEGIKRFEYEHEGFRQIGAVDL